MKKRIRCPRCGKEEIRKVGNPRGKQQYQCKECKRKFITEVNYKKEFKEKAIKIFYEGNSGRTVGRIMGINKSTVYNWIKKMNEKIDIGDKENKVAECKRVEIIEMDELFSYTKKKKTELT